MNHKKKDKERLTSISDIPENVKKYLSCNLLHSRVPKFTGNKIWNEAFKEYQWEIVHECKEGCSS